MNFTAKGYAPLRKGTFRTIRTFLCFFIFLTFTQGCGDFVGKPTKEDIAAFKETISITPKVDMARIQMAKLQTGPYRAVPGDVLEISMPALLQAVTATGVEAAQTQLQSDRPYVCRVNREGMINLPAVGKLKVGGLPLGEIEETIIKAYDEYVVLRPSVYVSVREYNTSKVYIAGAVENPGVYTLRWDQMSLVSLLTEAGGISEAGAAVVRILRSKNQETNSENMQNATNTENTSVHSDQQQPEPEALDKVGLSDDSLDPNDTYQSQNEQIEPLIVLPIVGRNIPFQDVALEEGDTVVVEEISMPMFSVLGLVRNPGNFSYPPNTEYRLAQAIASAGGLDRITDPRYATIYRLAKDGSVVRVSFKLVDGNKFTKALDIVIRPGDVVAVEQTLRTRTNALFNNLVRVTIGAYVPIDDLWD